MLPAEILDLLRQWWKARASQALASKYNGHDPRPDAAPDLAEYLAANHDEAAA